MPLDTKSVMTIPFKLISLISSNQVGLYNVHLKMKMCWCDTVFTVLPLSIEFMLVVWGSYIT